jgi:hypothetical protein
MSHTRQLPDRTRLDDNTGSGTSAGTDRVSVHLAELTTLRRTPIDDFA